jgi:protein ImuB
VLRLAALNEVSAMAGLAPGLPLAEARALLPSLKTRLREPEAEGRSLERLCDWAQRYSPWAACDPRTGTAGEAGLWLDVSGCAHLFGGEEALLDDLLGRLSRLGLTARAGLAGTPGAAWALARYAPEGARLLASGEERHALAGLPVAALRLEPWQEELLARFGLAKIGQLYDLPPTGLSPRLGRDLQRRLDQALGRLEEPLSPQRPQAPFEERLVFAEPVAATSDLERVAARLVPALCRRLRQEGQGLRRLAFTAHRADGSRDGVSLGVSRATRDPGHLSRLLAQHLERIDPGFGIEVLSLAALAAEPLSDLQLSLTRAGEAEEAAALIDRLTGHLGEKRVFRLAPRESHWPERAQAPRAPLEEKRERTEDWSHWRARARPLRLLARPEPIEALALLPDNPPARFIWRHQQHRVARAEGPERILPEWWSLEGSPCSGAQPLAARDYFRVEDEEGRRFWLFRSAGRWYLHGLFG